VTPVVDAGGAFRAACYRIAVDDTEQVLAAAPGAQLHTVLNFTSATEHLWRIDQLSGGVGSRRRRRRACLGPSRC
jgi:hypothetical protein